MRGAARAEQLFSALEERHRHAGAARARAQEELLDLRLISRADADTEAHHSAVTVARDERIGCALARARAEHVRSGPLGEKGGLEGLQIGALVWVRLRPAVCYALDIFSGGRAEGAAQWPAPRACPSPCEEEDSSRRTTADEQAWVGHGSSAHRMNTDKPHAHEARSAKFVTGGHPRTYNSSLLRMKQ